MLGPSFQKCGDSLAAVPTNCTHPRATSRGLPVLQSGTNMFWMVAPMGVSTTLKPLLLDRVTEGGSSAAEHSPSRPSSSRASAAARISESSDFQISVGADRRTAAETKDKTARSETHCWSGDSDCDKAELVENCDM